MDEEHNKTLNKLANTMENLSQAVLTALVSRQVINPLQNHPLQHQPLQPQSLQHQYMYSFGQPDIGMQPQKRRRASESTAMQPHGNLASKSASQQSNVFHDNNSVYSNGEEDYTFS